MFAPEWHPESCPRWHLKKEIQINWKGIKVKHESRADNYRITTTRCWIQVNQFFCHTFLAQHHPSFFMPPSPCLHAKLHAPCLPSFFLPSFFMPSFQLYATLHASCLSSYSMPPLYASLPTPCLPSRFMPPFLLHASPLCLPSYSMPSFYATLHASCLPSYSMPLLYATLHASCLPSYSMPPFYATLLASPFQPNDLSFSSTTNNFISCVRVS